ncbi:DUF544 family protein [Heterostelium album PN500]|uniref:DUF544 family protein n=1 Tax=Heterostelium pallidum (strain ATCC 26659 / Pp 5 / PN500) TaxID=670386 RepID=D3BD43_HETP5|nr:DUF544 family protein [Heterostelium album PN500]EFA80835.1 DUF544 family protein [Heterostelium album PN500]|eukprot:XP_020432954.1 DUF544 family protein [Heterostelium album PN500]
MSVTPSTDSKNKLTYPTKNGKVLEFDISEGACSKFGFFHGSRVTTPKGSATVIGVKDDNLWFHIDRDSGASFWDNGKDYEALLYQLGVQLDDNDFSTITDKSGQYRVKRVTYMNKPISIVLQNENGPCPLISIGNVLLLQQKISIDQDIKTITLKKLGDKIIGYARLIYHDNPDILPIIDDYDKNVLPSLETGLIVNIKFDNICGFDKTEPCQIFDYLKIKLVHGWIYPEEAEGHVFVSDLTYNDLAAKMTSFGQSFPDITSSTEEQIRDFFACNQLTIKGLELIKENLEEDELCVFFRNNHFATMTKHAGDLHILVSDVGYESESAVVWDKIIGIGGENLFLSGEFKTRRENQVEIARLDLLAIGYNDEQVGQAIDHVNQSKLTDSSEPFSIAIEYLNSKGYTPG